MLQILLQMVRLEKICLAGVCRHTIQDGHILAVVLIAVAHTDPVCIMMRIVLTSISRCRGYEPAWTDTNSSRQSGVGARDELALHKVGDCSCKYQVPHINEASLFMIKKASLETSELQHSTPFPQCLKYHFRNQHFTQTCKSLA